MRRFLICVFMFCAVQFWAQWNVDPIQDANNGETVFVLSGNHRFISPMIEKGKQDTWKSKVTWRTYDLNYPKNSFEEKIWEGEGVGYESEEVTFFSSPIQTGKRSWSKIQCISRGVVSDLMFSIEANDIQPSFDSSSGWLYFTSDRPGGYGGWDIYRCKQVNGQWSEAQNLGPGINTIYDEQFPLMTTEGLYLSSKTERGDWDIFFSPIHENLNVRWQLEYPINTTADEFQWIPFSEEYGWLISNREQSAQIKTSLFEFQKNLEKEQLCFVFRQPFVWKKNPSVSKAFAESKGCVEVSLGVKHHWQFLDTYDQPLKYEAFEIVNVQNEVIARLMTDSLGFVSWEYLGLEMGGINWWSVEDESNLLANAEGGILSVSSGKRPELPIILFQRNKSILEDSFFDDLQTLGMYLMVHPHERIVLTGSFDAIGDYTTNERLAWERAFMVQQFLMAHGALLNQIDVEIDVPVGGKAQDKDRKVEIHFQ